MNRNTLFILALGVLVNLAIWAVIYRPHNVPDWNGDKISGLSFSPYERGENPVNGSDANEQTIKHDLALLKDRVRNIRTYSTLGALQTIPAHANTLGLSITPGAWISKDSVRNQREVNALIDIAKRHKNIDRVLVGNEALLRQDVSKEALIALITDVQRQIRTPVSTAEPWHVWLDNPTLADTVDFIGVQILPYWEGVSIGDAVPHLLAKLKRIQSTYSDKPIVLTEVGWPSAGRAIGGARANQVNQARFLREFLNAISGTSINYFIVEAFDQPWKITSEGMAGGYWGLFDIDRKVKFSWTGTVRERDDWMNWAMFAIIVGAILYLGYARFQPALSPPGAVLLVVVTQAIGSTLAWALIPMASLYLSITELAVWGILYGATLFLLIGVFVDTLEATDLMWAGPLQRKFTPVHEHEIPPEGFPKVSIHVPICNEPAPLVRQTLSALASLDYPNYEVIVLDNNTDIPSLRAAAQAHCVALGRRFQFHSYKQLSGYKGGALDRALEHSAGDAEIIAVIDSDYVVSREWLKSLIPLFADTAIGFIQSPQDYRDQQEGTFKNFCFWEYAGFFRIGMVRRNEADAIIQHGTMTLIRREALQAAGGWADWCITEDAELGLRLAHKGWKSAYVAESFGQGVMPDSLDAYKAQRYRWAYGAMQILKRRWRWLAVGKDTKLSHGQRLQYLAGWFPWISDAAGFLFTLAAIVWTGVLAASPDTTELPSPAFLAPSLATFLFRQWRLFKLYGHGEQCSKRDRAKAALAGLALSHTVAKAVISGLFTSSRPFNRTPKCQRGPRLLRGLTMATEEITIFICLVIATIGFTTTNDTWHIDALLWVAILTVLTLPYGATIALGAINGLPTRAIGKTRARRGTAPVPAYPPGERRRRRQP